MMATCHPDHALISSDDVEGTGVYDSVGKRLGTIDHLMVDKSSGRVVFAVLSFGGFLGIDHRHFPLPWDALKYDKTIGGYRASVSVPDLVDSPQFSDDSWVDRHGEQWVHPEQGVPPFWL